MKLLALNWNDLKNPFAGGAEVHLEELLRRLVRNGHEVTLVCSGWEGCTQEEVSHGIRILRTGNRYTFNLVVPRLLRRLVRQESFDLLIEDINKIPFYTPLYLRLPTLVVIPHVFATTVFYEVNAVLATYIYLAELPMVPVYRGRLFNVISESTAEEIIRRGIPRGDVSVTYCGIDRTIYSHDPSVPKYERPTILYLGRLKKYKSVQHVIAALPHVRAAVPEVRLIIVGSGDYAETLKAQAASLGLADTVSFTGFVPQAEKVMHLRRSHVAVLPSRKEGWGLTNIEANAVGTPVLAADAPGLRDSVSVDQSGLLYPWGNIDTLASTLIRMLTERDVQSRLATGARDWAARFNWDQAAAEFEKVIAAAVARRK